MTENIQIILLLVVIALLLKQNDVLKIFHRQRKIIVDSCGLIDGRLLGLIRTNLLQGQILVPRFILKELQVLADGKDAYKRERARQGLESAEALREILRDNFHVISNLEAGTEPVDDKLLVLAKKLKADLYTIDEPLAKRAKADGISVIHAGRVAEAFRPVLIPGQRMKVKLYEKGSARDQAVGYTADGSMVVVAGAARYIGQTVTVRCDRIHSTVSGRLLFGRLIEAEKNRS